MWSSNRPKPQIKVHPKSWQYPLINYLIVIQVSTSQLFNGKIDLEVLLFYNIKIFKYWKHPFLPCKLFVRKIFLKKDWKHCQSVSKTIWSTGMAGFQDEYIIFRSIFQFDQAHQSWISGVLGVKVINFNKTFCAISTYHKWMFKLQISSIFNFDRAHQSWISGLLGVNTNFYVKMFDPYLLNILLHRLTPHRPLIQL